MIKMKKFNIIEIIKRTDRFTLLSALSGVLTILIFPGFNLSFLAWIAFIPLLVAVDGRSKGRSFRLGFLAGFISFAGILYWVVPTIVADGESALFAIFVLVLFSAILAAFYGIFCLGLNLFQSGKARPVIVNSLFAASLWVLVEWLRGHLFSGFPWAAFGYSQWRNLTVIQVSEFTAVYGVSFLIIFVNTVLKNVIMNFKGWRKVIGNKYVILALIIVMANSIFGAIRIYSIAKRETGDSVKVSILQGNIDQYMKWDDEYKEMIFNSYAGLTAEAKKEEPEIIVWPETAVPGYLRLDGHIHDWVTGLARFSGAYHVIGSPEYENGTYFNSAFLVSPDGDIVDRYDKIHLVPVGEYVPFRSALEKIFRVLGDLGDFSPGEEYRRFETPFGIFGTVICFESIFPDLTRKIVGMESDCLINITNDAWYLRTAALQQHFSMNVFRAVENRINIIRAANTGISGFINEYGGIEEETEIFEKACITARLSKRKAVTFYTRHGDVFAYLCIAFAILMGFIKMKNTRKKR